ncbi:acylphosphatase [Bacillus massiliigorillae]|uniref:acylphosphatase n=1 Tax=Bacillus massiliigorillae TaxID=1243664 RepID=UPI0003A9E2FB|nr:acylphosphatase [Bacillus massiliigorillae]
MNKVITIHVTGRVQKVGFRKSTAKLANKLHIKGWVSNTPDGGVQIEAEGAQDHLDAFIKSVSKGPLFAKVQSITVSETSTSTGYELFQVKTE